MTSTDTKSVVERLADAFHEAEYKPGDCPIVPVKIAAFMDAFRAALPDLLSTLAASEAARVKAVEVLNAALTMQGGEPIVIGYTNHRGEHAKRRIHPMNVWYGSTEWHPEPQWFLGALDYDKGEHRDFAIKDIGDANARIAELERDVDDLASGKIKTLPLKQAIAERDAAIREAAAYREALKEALTKQENDRTLWTPEWQMWAADARAALTQGDAT